MIRITNTDVYGWEAAIRGMRNPMNSWEKSDSEMCRGGDGFEDCRISINGECPRHDNFTHDVFCVGANDYALMHKLSDAGSDHGKFLRMINVTADINAPLYWWKEYDTYKVGTVANSCSTMHKIHAKDFTLDDFSHEHLWGEPAERDVDEPIGILNIVIDTLNFYRKEFVLTKDKFHWWQMIQLLPSSYNQLRTVQLNYQVLKNMYHARKNHKLDEWHDFCKWIETLPYSELITGRAADENGN